LFQIVLYYLKCMFKIILFKKQSNIEVQYVNKENSKCTACEVEKS
jgi:hypothetical protein